MQYGSILFIVLPWQLRFLNRSSVIVSPNKLRTGQ